MATPVIGIDYDNVSEIFPLDFGAVTFKNIFSFSILMRILERCAFDMKQQLYINIHI